MRLSAAILSVSSGSSQASIRSGGRITGVRSLITPDSQVAWWVMSAAGHSHRPGLSSAWAGSAHSSYSPANDSSPPAGWMQDGCLTGFPPALRAGSHS
jgi:hypothetical protein